jgi:hypothetical protein
MFEAITQTQADDYQSLEILKEAYAKVGREDDALKTSRRLAEAYFNVGSYTLAMQECEAVLVKQPNAPEILAMLGEIEARLHGSSDAASLNGAKNGLVATMSGSDPTTDGSLIDLNAPMSPHRLQDRGDDQLAKFLVMQQLFNEAEVAAAMQTLHDVNAHLDGQAIGACLTDVLCRDDEHKMGETMSALIDRTKFAFVPLEYYDVDRQIARMLPEALTLGRMFVPFDLISRTIMVACSNPFDAAGREAVQQSLDYTVAWYLARPTAIIKSLQNIYRLESRG